MDLAETFESTLLHELTHAVKTIDPNGEQLLNPNPDRVLQTDDIEKGDSYGTHETLSEHLNRR
jgi:hypothetical protein